jgi:hypothetical protein
LVIDGGFIGILMNAEELAEVLAAGRLKGVELDKGVLSGAFAGDRNSLLARGHCGGAISPNGEYRWRLVLRAKERLCVISKASLLGHALALLTARWKIS